MAASVADATAVTPKGTKRLLASGLSTFLIEDKPVLLMFREICLRIFLTLPFLTTEVLKIYIG